MPDVGSEEKHPEIEERGDPTTKKAPDKPMPMIDKPFKPDLGDKPRRKEIEDLAKEIKKKKSPKKRSYIDPASEPGPSIH